MSICKCGEEITTPFCAECGAGNESPLVSLHAHCKTQIKTQMVHLFDWKRRSAREKNVRPGAEEQREKVIRKWRSWADELEKLIRNKI